MRLEMSLRDYHYNIQIFLAPIPPMPVIYGQYICMFLKPANSDRENGIKNKIKMSPENYSCTAETGILEKTLFVMYQNNTVCIV